MEPSDRPRLASDELMRDFHAVLRRVLDEAPSAGGGPRIVDVLSEHLGTEPHQLAVVTLPVAPHRLVDADIAVAELSSADPAARLVGIAGDARHHMSFGDLVQRGMGLSVGQVDYDRMPTGPDKDDQRQVVTSGIRIFRFEGEPVAVRHLGMSPQFGREAGAIEVMARDRALSDTLIARAQELMDLRSVIRGRVVTFGSDPYGRGMAGITYVARPAVDAESVVLPAGVLDRVANHVIGMGEQRERLQAHGQHLKRGVLLYGPPGTGKTHTVR
jgi:hypothetical protein